MTVIIHTNIIAQYLENASFHWHSRSMAIHAPDWGLAELVNLDNRLDAWLDGLRVAQEEGWVYDNSTLEDPSGGDFFIAAQLALEQAKPETFYALLDQASTNPTWQTGIHSALGWIPFKRQVERLQGLLKTPASHAQ